MEKLKAFVKKHPYASGGIVLGVGLVLLFALRGGSSGGANAGGITGSQALQASEQAAQLQAALAGQQSQQSTALQEAELQAAVQKAQIGGTLQADQISAALQEALAKTQGKNTVAAINAQGSQQTSLAGLGLLGSLGQGLFGLFKSPTVSTISFPGGGGITSSSGGSSFSLSSLFGSSGASDAATIAPDLSIGTGQAITELPTFTTLPTQVAGDIGGFGGDLGSVFG